MATAEPIASGGTYTISEAVEYMKMKDKYATDIRNPIRWANIKTGREVVIGYTS